MLNNYTAKQLSDYNAMESLATQNRSLFTKFKQWFVRNFIGTRETRTKISNPKAAALKTYALMLRAEKAAMNSTQSGEGVSYSTKNGADTKKPLETVNTKRYNKSTKYDEYNSLVYQWSYSTSTQPGDMRIFNNKGKDFRLLKATENGGYIEMARGNFKKVEAIYERLYEREDWAFHGDTQIFRTEQRGDFLNMFSNENGIDDQSDSSVIGREGVQNDTSGNNEHNLPSDNGRDISYSAKKSETVQRIIDNFNYNDVTANNIVKAARSLKQKSDSKADLKELAYTIAQTLENRRTGNADSTDAERIAMMLAEDAKALNEDFIAENKPILDRLNGMTISISEADISDLGDAFSYIKGKLFPYVTLTKGTDSSVDSIFQDLAAEFPFAFDAEAVTHPADQVKAIMGFIEDYRNNKYYRPYFEDNEAFGIRNVISQTF